MQSKNQTDTAGTDTQSTWAPYPWQWYKRYSDNKKVEARLLPRHYQFLPEGPLMEVKESKGEDRTCPECKTMLSKGNGNETPNSFLPPDVFHSRHKPLDDQR